MEAAMDDPGKSFGKFLLLWSGELVSSIGSGITAFGLGVYVFERTGKASAVALITLLAFMPSLLLSAVTVASTLVVRSGLASKKCGRERSFICEFKDGWGAVSGNRGVLILVIMTSVVTFFLGFIQTLSTPMILAFSDSFVLGTVQTIAASGMLVTSVMIGILPIKRNYAKLLYVSLFCAGIFIAVFGLRENIVLICVSGFLFFAMLPFANTSLDFLIRTNIENGLQGRAWGLIGVISQLGYVAAYALSGALADYVFTPLLLEGGMLAGSVGKIIGTGTGRGTGFLIFIAGVLVCLTSVMLYNVKSVKMLENRGDLCITE